jgi:hypothetical protein
MRAWPPPARDAGPADDAVLATVAQGLVPQIDRVTLFEPDARMLTLQPERRARERPWAR